MLKDTPKIPRVLRSASLREDGLFSPVHPDHARAIGYVAIEWAHIEVQVAFIASGLLGVGNSGAFDAVTAEISSMARFKLAKAALEALRHRLWLDALEDIYPKFNELQALRNDLVHGEWKAVGKSHWLHRVRAVDGVKTRSQEFSTEQVLETLREIRDLRDALVEFSAVVLPQVTEAIRTSHEREPLLPGQSRRALAQAQSRAEKEARKTRDRDRSTNKPTRLRTEGESD